MRQLEQHQVNYIAHQFNKGQVATTNVPIYKTLVTVAKSHQYYVFVLPVTKELDLKQAAIAVNEKSIEMIKEKELFPLTGYVHGGCSPIGMKKFFRTVFDHSIHCHESIIFSAGKVGHSVEIKVDLLSKVIEFNVAAIAKDK